MNKIDAKVLEMLSQDKFDSNIARILQQDKKIEVLVRVQNPLQFSHLEKHFEIAYVYPFIRSVGIRCGLDDVMCLGNMREVEYVSAQSKVFALDVINTDAYQEFAVSQKNIGNLRFDSGLDGSGVTMCVMDTGVAPHADLSIPKERIVHFVDMINGESNPYDDNGHGTFVAGVACGSGMTSAKNVVGVAPKANIVGIKVIGKEGESGAFKILDGMQWLFDNFKQYGIRVVCMSFGADPLDFADPLKIGVEMLSRSGLIVVVASGNSGVNQVKSPAISNQVIAVGAVDESNNIASFSSRGVYNGVMRPDVYANGVDVKGIKVGGTYTNMSGTSAAAPYVAGACCLLCQKYPYLTPYQAKNIILNNSIVSNGVRIFR